MANKPMVLTAEGLKKMTDELDYLKNTKRVEVKEQIAIARSFGDLSENSEYDEAKNEQAKVESRISDLKNVVVISDDELSSGIINVGMNVKVYDEQFDEEVTYSIVGSNEVDPFNNLISDQSPIGNALIGKKVGDEAEVEAPSGIIKLKILEVHRRENNN